MIHTLKSQEKRFLPSNQVITQFPQFQSAHPDIPVCMTYKRKKIDMALFEYSSFCSPHQKQKKNGDLFPYEV